MTAAISIEGVCKTYAGRAVLREVTLQVPAATTWGLVGANGAGKTTLIKCLLDFCALDAGRISLLGRPHRTVEARRVIAHLPENFLPPHYLTGREFVRYLQTLRGIPYSEADTQAACAALDLDSQALDRPARTYSKGMTRKLGLVACLVSGAQLFVLDEPMSGLDPKARALLKDALGRLAADGRTVFMSTHALADVEELCNAMAILHEGTLRFTGTPAACRAQFGAATLEAAYLATIA
ncbi:ABC transporter ATP-binding protein [Thiobacter aerophilum]|uniref:ABC transporter ATP-binding protein n=1 Tax=Thiobacter aerophilum TaxID=3121275 RepID=A0ABV0EDN5_9BURK